MGFAFIVPVILSEFDFVLSEFLDWKSSVHVSPPTFGFRTSTLLSSRTYFSCFRLFAFFFFFFFKTSFLRRNHTRCFGDSPSISCVLKRQIAKLNHCFLCKTLCFPRPKGKQQFLYPSFSVWSSLQSHFELLWFYFSLCLFIFGLWVSGLSNSRWKRN